MKEEAEGKFYCEEYSIDLFTASFGIASEKRSVKQVLTLQQKQDPVIIEKLQSCLSFFYPSTCDKVSKLMLTQFSNMNLEHVQYLVNIQNQMDEPSYALMIAHKKTKEFIYFASVREACTYLEKIDQCLQAYIEAKGTNAPKERLKELKNKLKEAQEEVKKVKRSPLGHYYASRYIDHKNPLIRMEAQKAHHVLEIYCETITEALKASGANMSRTDLLEHIIGPKNFLFSHYGIVALEIATDIKKPFRFVPILQGTCMAKKRPYLAPIDPLSFELNHQTPQELEADIRKQIFYICHHSEHSSQLANAMPSLLILDNTLSVKEEQQEETLISENNFELEKNSYRSLLASENFPSETLLKQIQLFNEQKNEIYFFSSEEAQQWFKDHPKPKQFKKKKLNMKAQYYASLHTHHENPKIQMAALKSKQIHQAYCKAIMSALKNSGAHVHRKDLLEHLIGPKNFLFSYYGLIPSGNSTKPGYPFCFIPEAINTYEYEKKSHLTITGHSGFGYHLENLSPKALEKEICSDLISLIERVNYFVIERLPKVVIQSDEITYPITSELQHLREEVLPKLMAWNTLNLDEKISIKQLILDFNKWNKYEVQPQHIELNISEKKFEDEESQITAKINIIRGEITLPNSKVYPIYFNTHDFLLIIQVENHINPGTLFTHQFLSTNYK